jgi:phenylpropionate dioxygenase-like ring-hydroxylating dioxygenase large terminal subunit
MPDRILSAEDPTSFPSYEEILRKDRRKPPSFLFERSTRDLGNAPESKDCYVSAHWHDAEAEKLWAHCWQAACRENDVPEVGDQVAYDIVDQSVLIVRVAKDDIRAFHNTCRHRGNRILEGCTNAEQIQCAFHGWTWNLDGSLRSIPCRWDFPAVRDAEYGLVECPTERWNGFVFVNLDPDAGPLSEHLGDEIPAQLDVWSNYRTRKVAHVGKVIPCNWKLALEAFLETWHVPLVHPGSMYYCGDVNSQYDFYGPHARMLTPMGVSSPHLGDVDPQQIVEHMIGGQDALLDALADVTGGSVGATPQLSEGQGARQLLADVMKANLSVATGIPFDAVSDAEALDGFEYFIFPNLILWGGYFFPLNYRFRPNGRDVESCIMELMVLSVVANDAPLERDVALRMIPSDQPWGETELGTLGSLIDQDSVALYKIQRGIRSDSYQHVTFSNYQERNIRNFHAHLRRIVES